MEKAMTPAQILYDYRWKKQSHSLPVVKPTILYQAEAAATGLTFRQKMGIGLITLTVGALFAAIFPFIQLEVKFKAVEAADSFKAKLLSLNPFYKAKAVQNGPVQPDINVLFDTAGNPIVPASEDFGLVIPKIGVNAPVIPGVNPASKAGYLEALKEGVAHASTSFYPNENGTVYLFSHSTNYEWFVKDLNAVFYLIKNLQPGDFVVVMYMGNRYTYQIREKQIVSRKAVAFLNPQPGVRNLILQTCWPPGTSDKRMLIFADFVAEHVNPDYHPASRSTVSFSQLSRL